MCRIAVSCVLHQYALACSYRFARGRNSMSGAWCNCPPPRVEGLDLAGPSALASVQPACIYSCDNGNSWNRRVQLTVRQALHNPEPKGCPRRNCGSSSRCSSPLFRARFVSRPLDCLQCWSLLSFFGLKMLPLLHESPAPASAAYRSIVRCAF